METSKEICKITWPTQFNAESDKWKAILCHVLSCGASRLGPVKLLNKYDPVLADYVACVNNAQKNETQLQMQYISYNTNRVY